MPVCLYACMPMCLCAYVPMCMCACMHMCLYACMPVCICRRHLCLGGAPGAPGDRRLPRLASSVVRSHGHVQGELAVGRELRVELGDPHGIGGVGSQRRLQAPGGPGAAMRMRVGRALRIRDAHSLSLRKLPPVLLPAVPLSLLSLPLSATYCGPLWAACVCLCCPCVAALPACAVCCCDCPLLSCC